MTSSPFASRNMLYPRVKHFAFGPQDRSCLLVIFLLCVHFLSCGNSIPVFLWVNIPSSVLAHMGQMGLRLPPKPPCTYMCVCDLGLADWNHSPCFRHGHISQTGPLGISPGVFNTTITKDMLFFLLGLLTW